MVNITSMGANKMEGTANTFQPDSLLLLQNHYPNWKAYIDGKAVPIGTSAICFMAIPISAGTHTFSFIYDPTYLHWALWLPIAGIVIIISITFSKGQKEKRQKGTLL